MGIASGIVAPGGTTTTDATAEQWHVKSGKTAYIASGKVTGTAYTPAMMNLGAAGYYTASYTASGNKVTAVIRFAIPSFSGGAVKTMLAAIPSGGVRAVVYAYANDHADTDRQDCIQVTTSNSAATNICRLFTTAGSYLDGNPHTLFYEFDGDAGSAVWRIDGTAIDDTGNADRIAPTTGTLGTGTTTFLVGKDGATNYLVGQAGYCGMRDVGGLTWSDFMQTDGSPKNIESTLSTVWGGGTPLFWNPHGDMANNLGSAGAMTKNGTINVGNGGT